MLNITFWMDRITIDFGNSIHDLFIDICLICMYISWNVKKYVKKYVNWL